MKLLFASAVAIALVLPVRAAAFETAYEMYLVTPYPNATKTPVAGPFPTLGECLSAEPYGSRSDGSRYECELI